MLKLFTTETCPNCKMAETLLKTNNIEFEKIVCDENEETKRLANQYNIKQAPTLIINDEERKVGLGPIRGWIVKERKS